MIDKKKYYGFILLSIFITIVIITTSLNAMSGGQPTKDIVPFNSIVSTRNHFNLTTGEILPGHNQRDYSATNIPGLQYGVCPAEIAIIIHGWNNTEGGANERFDRANMSLQHNNYHNPVIGFSWDSNTTIQPIKAGWTIANLISKENGPKLAQLVFDYKDTCNTSKVRIVAHSLGARVVLSALDSLYNNQEWKNKNFKITSVHLLGAAVDDEEVAKDPLYIVNNASIVNDTLDWYDVYGIKSAFGKPIEKGVINFYNLFNPADTTLLNVYKNVEHDNALGLKGAQINITKPFNYTETNIQNKIPPLCSADGTHIDPGFHKGNAVNRGENHAGYFGFRDPANDKVLLDDGAINTVVRDWNNTLAVEKPDSPSSSTC